MTETVQQMRQMVFKANRGNHGGIQIRLSSSFWPEWLFDFGDLKKALDTPLGPELKDMVRDWAQRVFGGKEFYVGDGRYLEHDGGESHLLQPCPFHGYVHREIVPGLGSPIICHEAWVMKRNGKK